MGSSKQVILSTGVSKTERLRLEQAKELDPSLREFQFPDFGFQDKLNTDINASTSSIWALLYDHICTFPKFERLRNYIRRKAHMKLEILRRQIEAEAEE